MSEAVNKDLAQHHGLTCGGLHVPTESGEWGRTEDAGGRGPLRGSSWYQFTGHIIALKHPKAAHHCSRV